MSGRSWPSSGALRAGIAARGLACEAMTDGVAVRIDDRTVYEPDALVRCGERTPGEAVTITDPMIVVEVVSPSSAALDSGDEARPTTSGCRACGTIWSSTSRPRAVAHHRLDDGGAIATRILRAGGSSSIRPASPSRSRTSSPRSDSVPGRGAIVP